MDFTQKLIHLTANLNKSKLATEAGLPATAISNYITKKQIPRGDSALVIARALKVPLEWLLDDTQEWPPPPTTSASSMSTDQLAEELGRRMGGIAVAMLAKLVRVSGADFVALTRELLAADPEADLPRKTRQIFEACAELNALASELKHYDPRTPIGDGSPPELLKSFGPDYEVSMLDLTTRHRNLKNLPGFHGAFQLASLWLIPREYRPSWFKENVAHARKVAEAALVVAEAVREQQDRIRVFNATGNDPMPEGENPKSASAVRRKR
jgi:hypothetical protein